MGTTELIIKPILQNHYGSLVYTNLKTDELRKTECMCLNCSELHPGEYENCDMAEKLFNICKKYDGALMITRCKNYKEKVK